MNYNSGITVDTNCQLARLKYFIEHIYSGGTPNTENSEYWTTDPRSGYAWVSIGDMSSTDLVSTTYKCITEEGRLSKNLEILPAGTLIYSMYASMGHVALLKIPATINQALLGLKFSIGIDIRYAKWWLTYLKDYVVAEASSNTQNNLNAEKVKNLPFPVIRLKTQQKIADYLDRETARIDALIEAKEKMLSLLDEKRQALISRAVTKGLDPNVEMKDSGIEWLGEIPAHWEVLPVKYCFDVIGSGTTPPTNQPQWYGDEIPWVTTSELRENVIKKTQQMLTKEALEKFSALKIYPAGSLLIAMYGATIGRVAILGVKATVNQAVCVLSRGTRLNEKFTFYAFQVLKKFLISMATGGGQPNLNAEKIKEFILAIPPIQEQKQIVNHIDTFTEKSLQLSKEIKKSIALLKERRAALIIAAVAGEVGGKYGNT